MSTTKLDDQIEMLRVHLEIALPLPLVLLLSSARTDDQTSVVAAALARNLEAAGYSTLLVLANTQSHEIDGALAPKTLDDVAEFGIAPYVFRAQRTNLRSIVLPSETIRTTVSQMAVRRFTDVCRSSFQVTIIEGASILTSSFALLAAVQASGVVLTIKEGRRVTRADRQVAETLTRADASFLGVVSVSDSVVSSIPKPSQPWSVIRRPTATTVSGEAKITREGQAV